MAKWTGKRTSVMYSKPAEPSFLTKFKEQVGYKEDHGLSDKFATMPEATDGDTEDRDDELPQVVSLKDGDITPEEYEKLKAEGKLDDLLDDDRPVVQGPKMKEEEPASDGRIMFRKPTKRSVEDGHKKDVKKPKGGEKSEEVENPEKLEKPEKVNKKDKKKQKQKIKLLSFNEDEEEEEEDL